MSMEIIFDLESQVRSYSRAFPTVFTKAEACYLFNDRDEAYLDFFSGAGALNYGHNHPKMKQGIINYLNNNGIVHSLDMATEAKCKFIFNFNDIILKPLNYQYKMQFPGPTGTNAVEAALKLARKFTQRKTIVAFTGAFHGMTLGSLSISGSRVKRGSYTDPSNVVFMPYDGFLGKDIDSLQIIEQYLKSNNSGIDLPAAFVVETIQAEGGVNVAHAHWLEKLARLAKHFGSLLIVDDIQVGCGRCGNFFSFSEFDFVPDIVCLSKSLSGIGLPFSVVLLKPEIDVWDPGEHNGTFRGNNLAFITATIALDFWKNDLFTSSLKILSKYIYEKLVELSKHKLYPSQVKGRGLLYGLEWSDPSIAKKISSLAFQKKLIIETSGEHNQVLKFLPPLVITQDKIDLGIEIIRECLDELEYMPTNQSRTTCAAKYQDTAFS